MRDTNYRWKQEQEEQQQFELLKASAESWDRIFGNEVKLIRQSDFNFAQLEQEREKQN